VNKLISVWKKNVSYFNGYSLFFQSPILSEFMPTLLLWTAAALLPVLVVRSDQWLSHWTRSKRNHSIMRKTFVFLLFMGLILPSLGLPRLVFY